MLKILLVLGLAAGCTADHWAVIMAGSNTYANYRHQADACHAYQIAKKNGIPESNIILLAYDDIAHNQRNPFHGKIFNKPTPSGHPGQDVYDGCKISYKGQQVNKENFIKVLSGDTSAPGPVLKSGKNDNVFVYYADHGGVGILGVPALAAGGYIHAADVNSAIETLQKKGGYKELLFYVEACESGSIFENLLTAPNAKAVTAANASESSYGWYCSNPLTGGDVVDGMAIGSCLGDEFSVRWMEDTDSEDVMSETIAQQFTKVKGAVKKSHVQEYGATSFDAEPLGNFQGGGQASTPGFEFTVSGEGVDSRQVEVHVAYYRVLRAKTAEERKQAEAELAAILVQRHESDMKFGRISLLAMKGNAEETDKMLEGTVSKVLDVDCHKASLGAAVKYCGPFTDYSMRYSRLFANLCAEGVQEQDIVSAIQTGCAKAVVV